MTDQEMIQDAEAEVQTRSAAQGLKFNNRGHQSEVFRADGSRVCWLFASHGVLQVQFDNVSNTPKGTFLEPVYQDFRDPVKAAAYVLSLV
jgi:hypothetical protein